MANTPVDVLRPYGVMVEGRLELGLEIVCEDGGPRLRPHTGVPDRYVASAPFVNAHSHLEYRGLMGTMLEREYFPWIQEIARRKPAQGDDEVRGDCLLAAHENRASGVGWIAEHSDRPFAAEALVAARVPGRIYQEVITFLEANGPESRIRRAEERARDQSAAGILASTSPHSPYTVDPGTLASFAGSPISIHVAESDLENRFFRDGEGPIADLYASYGVPYEATGLRVIEWLDGLGLLRPGVQFVHACAVSDSDIQLMADRGVSVAHCPRSNLALACPHAPIRRMLESGIRVGLGLDSAASSGPIDFFAEMRAALAVTRSAGEPLHAETVWRLGTEAGARSLGLPSWGLSQGILAIHVPDAHTTEELIERGAPHLVEWLR